MQFDPGLPESFNVLVKELKSLALNVELMKREKTDVEALMLQNMGVKEA